MSLVAKSFTFTTGATIVAAEHNDNFDTIYNDHNGNINNDNISPTAGIVDTKLATITSTGKVNGSALSALGNIQTNAGNVPTINAGTPTGAWIPYGGNTTPSGYVFCDGTAYDSVTDGTFAALFAVIGNNFGGTDGTDFQVPDMRGRIPLGKDDMGGSSANRVTDAEADTLGSGSGLQLQPVGSHTHVGGSHTHPQNSNGTNATTFATDRPIVSTSTFGSDMRATLSGGTPIPTMASGVSAGGVVNTGGSSSSSNNVVQPYQTGNYIIKK